MRFHTLTILHFQSRHPKQKKLISFVNSPKESDSYEEEGDDLDDDDKERKINEEYEQEFKFVFTQPPWDLRLKRTDRVFLLLPDTKKWKRMMKADQTQGPPTLAKHSLS